MTNEHYVYVFVRQDLSLPQQVVQSNHATFSMATLLQLPWSVPNMVVIGVPDTWALGRVLDKLRKNSIVHYAWSEPDFDYGLTAIATAPLGEEQRKALQNYRVWSERNVGGTVGIQQFAGLHPTPTPDTSVAQG